MNRKVQIDGVYRHCNTWWLDIGKNVRKVVVPCGRFVKRGDPNAHRHTLLVMQQVV